MSELQRAADAWHTKFARAFITQVSTGDGEYFLKLKFKTMGEMHAAYDAMAKLAALSVPGSTHNESPPGAAQRKETE